MNQIHLVTFRPILNYDLWWHPCQVLAVHWCHRCQRWRPWRRICHCMTPWMSYHASHGTAVAPSFSSSHIWTFFDPYLNAVISMNSSDAHSRRWRGIQALGVSVCRQFEEEEWHTTISIAANRPYLVHLRALHDFYRFWIRGWKQANRKMRSGSKHTSTKGVLASIRRPLGCSTWLRDPLLSLESDRNQTYSKFLYQPLPCLLSTKDWCLTIQVISLNFSFLYVLFCQRFWSVEFSCLTTFNDGLLGQSMTALISAKISW